MKKEIAEQIYKKIYDEWVNRYGKENLDNDQLEALRNFILECPDDDGYKRVTNMTTGKTHLVPYEDIILHGLKGSELNKYPLEGGKNENT